MFNEEMRKYLDILNENEQVDEINLRKAAKGALGATALAGALHFTDPGQTEFAQYLEAQIEQTQDPIAKKQMEKDLDSFIVASLEGDATNNILKRYGWTRENEVPDWAKEPEQEEPASEPKLGAKPGDVEFDYNQVNINPTTRRR